MVYKYGCPRWADFDESAMTQLRLVNRLWNDAVEVCRNYEAVENDVLAQTSDDVAAAETAVMDAEKLVDECVDHMKNQRKRMRTTAPDAADKVALRDARSSCKTAKIALKVARKDAREHAKPLIRAIREAKKEALKATRQHAAASGLYWGTYNDVMGRRLPIAIDRVFTERKMGRPSELHFKRFDGSGTLTTQLMWQSGQPITTTERVMDGEYSAAKIKVDGKYGELTLRVASNHLLVVPFVYHRPIPYGAEVKEIKVSRRRTGSQWRLSVAICVRLPKVAPRASGSLAAIRFQQITSDKATQIAVVSSSEPFIDPPAELEDVVKVSTDRRTVAVSYSSEWREMISRDFHIRSVRDQDLNTVRDQIITELSDENLASVVGVTAAQVARWKAPHRFVTLHRRWPDEHPFKDKYSAWLHRDRHLWDYEANEFRQVLDRRDDAYRKAAAWLLSSVKEVALHGVDLAERRRTPDVDREDTSRRGRAIAHAASPGYFRAAVANFASMHGIAVNSIEEN